MFLKILHNYMFGSLIHEICGYPTILHIRRAENMFGKIVHNCTLVILSQKIRFFQILKLTAYTPTVSSILCIQSIHG